MSESEWKQKKANVIIRKEGIHSRDQLLRYMADEQVVRLPFDNVQFQFILLPDFEDNRGAIILKVHHSFADGLGLSSFMLYMLGNYSAKDLPGLKPLSLIKKIFIDLIGPFLLFVSLCYTVVTPFDYNVIKKD